MKKFLAYVLVSSLLLPAGLAFPSGARAETLELEYDANGNLIRKGNQTFVWDMENRLERIEENGKTLAEYVYDGDGNRIVKTEQGKTTKYIGDSFEVSGDGIAKYYFAGAARIAQRTPDGKLLFYLADHLGGANVITSATGLVAAIYEYFPYGSIKTVTGTLNSNKLYTGQEYNPETQLYDFKFRHQDPALLAFAKADNLVPNPSNPQDLNRYSYVNNNPINQNDPDGHFAIAGALIGAGIGGFAGFMGSLAGQALAGQSLNFNAAIAAGASGVVSGAFVGSGGFLVKLGVSLVSSGIEQFALHQMGEETSVGSFALDVGMDLLFMDSFKGVFKQVGRRVNVIGGTRGIIGSNSRRLARQMAFEGASSTTVSTWIEESYQETDQTSGGGGGDATDSTSGGGGSSTSSIYPQTNTSGNPQQTRPLNIPFGSGMNNAEMAEYLTDYARQRADLVRQRQTQQSYVNDLGDTIIRGTGNSRARVLSNRNVIKSGNGTVDLRSKSYRNLHKN